MTLVRLKTLSSFGFDGGGEGIGEWAGGIALAGSAMILDMQAPAGAQALQRIVHRRPHGDQFVIRGTVQIGPAKSISRQERAVFIQDYARMDQTRPGEIVAEFFTFMAVFGDVEHKRQPSK